MLGGRSCAAKQSWSMILGLLCRTRARQRGRRGARRRARHLGGLLAAALASCPARGRERLQSPASIRLTDHVPCRRPPRFPPDSRTKLAPGQTGPSRRAAAGRRADGTEIQVEADATSAATFQRVTALCVERQAARALQDRDGSCCPSTFEIAWLPYSPRSTRDALHEHGPQQEIQALWIESGTVSPVLAVAGIGRDSNRQGRDDRISTMTLHTSDGRTNRGTSAVDQQSVAPVRPGTLSRPGHGDWRFAARSIRSDLTVAFAGNALLWNADRRNYHAFSLG